MNTFLPSSSATHSINNQINNKLSSGSSFFTSLFSIQQLILLPKNIKINAFHSFKIKHKGNNPLQPKQQSKMKLSIFAAVAILGFAAAAPAEKRDTVAQCAQNLGHCDAAVAPGDVAGYDACHNTVGFIHSPPPPSLLPCSS